MSLFPVHTDIELGVNKLILGLGKQIYSGASGLIIKTDTGTVEIGSGNSGFSHFNTSNPAFYLNKPMTVNGAILPYSTGTFHVGSSSKRWHTIVAIYGSFTGNVTTITPTSANHAATKAYVDGMTSPWKKLGTLNNNLVPLSNNSLYSFGSTAAHNIAIINDGIGSSSFTSNASGSLTVMNLTTSNDYYNHSPGSILTGTNCTITSEGYGHSIVGGHSNTIKNFSAIQAYNCGIVNGTSCTVSARRGLLLGCRNVTLENPNTASATIMIGCNDTTAYNGTTWDGIIMGVNANLTPDSTMPIKMGNATVYGTLNLNDTATNPSATSECLTIDSGGRTRRRDDNKHLIGSAGMTTTSDYDLAYSRIHKSIDGVVTVTGEIRLKVAKNLAVGSYQTIATFKSGYKPLFADDNPGATKVSMWKLGWIIASAVQYNVQYALVATSGDIRVYYLPTNGMGSQQSLTGSAYLFRLDFTFPTR